MLIRMNNVMCYQGLSTLSYPAKFYCFVFFQQDVVIQSDDEIRIKIVGTRVDAKDIVSILGQKFFICWFTGIFFQI